MYSVFCLDLGELLQNSLHLIPRFAHALVDYQLFLFTLVLFQGLLLVPACSASGIEPRLDPNLVLSLIGSGRENVVALDIDWARRVQVGGDGEAGATRLLRGGVDVGVRLYVFGADGDHEVRLGLLALTALFQVVVDR